MYLTCVHSNDAQSAEDWKKWVPVFTKQMGVTGLLVLSLSACWSPGAKPPDVKINPSPKDRYEITLTIEDPPGVVQRIDGQVQFDIEGVYHDCMPYADRIAGIKPKSSFTRPVDFERKSNNTYIGYIFADWLVDEDYYGLGICKWLLTGVAASIHIGKADQTVVLRDKEILGEGTRAGACRRDIEVSDICISPLNGVKGVSLERNFIATLRSRRVLP